MYMMTHFRVSRTIAGQMYIDEMVLTRYGYLWRNVCFRQLNFTTGEYE